MKIPSIMSPDGRRAWAFAAIVGGSMVFTVFAAVGVYLVRGHSQLVFWLTMAAHVQILVCMTALGWALGRRVIVSGGRDGVSISDSGPIKIDVKPTEAAE